MSQVKESLQMKDYIKTQMEMQTMNIEKVFSHKLLSTIKKLKEINAENLHNLWEKLEKLTEIRSENNNNADNNEVEKSYSTIVKRTTASESTADRNKAK
ncbi:hypothetical protein JTB14_037029 [Gonioctena quinquepunctata]|nr:hypothetical protein JTB14_037029 [Gonioctena quinquepunctata]